MEVVGARGVEGDSDCVVGGDVGGEELDLGWGRGGCCEGAVGCFLGSGSGWVDGHGWGGHGKGQERERDMIK